MILPNTGEVIFLDGLHFHPHGKLLADTPGLPFPPVPGWSKFTLGPHPADRGEFEVVFYSTELHVPLGRVEGLHQLFAREALPTSR